MKTINFTGSVWSCLPRILWQGLFDYYREFGDLSNMDNMLIDLKNCDEVINEIAKETKYFLWGCEKSYSDTLFFAGTQQEVIAYSQWQLYHFMVIVKVTKDEATFEVVKNLELREDA